MKQNITPLASVMPAIAPLITYIIAWAIPVPSLIHGICVLVYLVSITIGSMIVLSFPKEVWA